MKDKETYFKRIYAENKDRIYRICCSYHCDGEARKDIFQEVIANIWRGLDNFKGRSAVGTWIFRITVNTCLGFVRKNKKIKLHLELSDDELQQVGDPTDLDASRETESDIQFLYSCLNRLPTVEKTVISLLLEGLDYCDIADVCGLSQGNVRVIVHRSKARLKHLMEGK
jgi:RNA polymerase sigma-70 factor, ECF subfamily